MDIARWTAKYYNNYVVSIYSSFRIFIKQGVKTVFSSFTAGTHKDQRYKIEKYNMSKFTCLVLCAVAVNFNGVHVSISFFVSWHHFFIIHLTCILFLKAFGDVQAILSGCAKEYGLTEDSLQVIMSAKDVAKLDPCFWACMLKKAEFVSIILYFSLKM